jgi:hypothetical protein
MNSSELLQNATRLLRVFKRNLGDKSSNRVDINKTAPEHCGFLFLHWHPIPDATDGARLDLFDYASRNVPN